MAFVPLHPVRGGMETVSSIWECVGERERGGAAGICGSESRVAYCGGLAKCCCPLVRRGFGCGREGSPPCLLFPEGGLGSRDALKRSLRPSSSRVCGAEEESGLLESARSSNVYICRNFLLLLPSVAGVFASACCCCWPAVAWASLSVVAFTIGCERCECFPYARLVVMSILCAILVPLALVIVFVGCQS